MSKNFSTLAPEFVKWEIMSLLAKFRMLDGNLLTG